MTKRATGAARKKSAKVRARPAHLRPGGSIGGKGGAHSMPQRQLRAPRALFDLIDRALAHNIDSDADGAYSGWTDWARHHLAIAAADELGLDPLDALALVNG